MLEDEKQNILLRIAKANKSIQKDEKTIDKFHEKQKNTDNRMKQWFYRWRIEREYNDIKTKKQDIEDYEMDLKLTEEAILSQQRDTQMIEDYTYLPRPSILTDEMNDTVPEAPESPHSPQATLLGSILQGIANSINGFFNPKKEEAANPNTESSQPKSTDHQ